MIRFTVVWHPLALNDLAELWIDSSRRDSLSTATTVAERILRYDPHFQGFEVSERARSLKVGLLELLFRFREADRVVEIYSATRSD